MRIVQDVLSGALLASGLVGIQILVNDRWLWAVAPSHAYGLIGFVLIDIVLVAAALRRIGLGALCAILLGTTQLSAMLADLVGGQPDGVPAIAFRNYLLSDTSYLSLLLMQIAVIAIAVAGLASVALHTNNRWIQVLRHHSQVND